MPDPSPYVPQSQVGPFPVGKATPGHAASDALTIHDPQITHEQLTADAVSQEVYLATLKPGELIDRVFIHHTEAFTDGKYVATLRLIVHDFDFQTQLNVYSLANAPNLRLDGTVSFVSQSADQGDVFGDAPRALSILFTAIGVDVNPLVTGSPLHDIAKIIHDVASENGIEGGYVPGDTGLISGAGNGDAGYLVDSTDGNTMGAIVTSHLEPLGGGGGDNWQTGDTFSVNTGLPGFDAAGVVDSVSVTGFPTAYHLTSNGHGFSPATDYPCNNTTLGGQGQQFVLQVDTVTGGRVTALHLTTPGTGYPDNQSGVTTTAGGTQPGVGVGLKVQVLGFQSAFAVVAVLADGRHSSTQLAQVAGVRDGQTLDWTASAVPEVDHYDIYVLTYAHIEAPIILGKVATVPGNQTTYLVTTAGGDSSTPPSDNTLPRLKDIVLGSVDIYLEIVNLAP